MNFIVDILYLVVFWIIFVLMFDWLFVLWVWVFGERRWVVVYLEIIIMVEVVVLRMCRVRREF